jgi:hypothetical protein
MLKCCSIDPAGGGVKPNEPKGRKRFDDKRRSRCFFGWGEGVTNLLQLHLIT